MLCPSQLGGCGNAASSSTYFLCCGAQKGLPFSDHLTPLTILNVIWLATGRRKQYSASIICFGAVCLPCLSCCLLANAAVVEEVLRDPRNYHDFENKGELILGGYVTPLTIEEIRRYRARLGSAPAALSSYILRHLCTNRFGLILSCVSHPKLLGALASSSVSTFCALACVSRRVVLCFDVSHKSPGSRSFGGEHFNKKK